jgi:hypothetical protein
MSNRIATLNKILNRQKIAQEIVEPSTINQATADKMANDIFEKIFYEELNKLVNKTPVV